MNKEINLLLSLMCLDKHNCYNIEDSAIFNNELNMVKQLEFIQETLNMFDLTFIDLINHYKLRSDLKIAGNSREIVEDIVLKSFKQYFKDLLISFGRNFSLESKKDLNTIDLGVVIFESDCLPNDIYYLFIENQKLNFYKLNEIFNSKQDNETLFNALKLYTTYKDLK